MLKKILVLSVLMSGIFFASATNTSAQSKVVVKFAKNQYAKKLSGTVAKYAYIDYIVAVDQDQFLDVTLKSKNGSLGFVILDPRGNNVPNGTDVREYNDLTSKKGKYTVRVLLPRSAARRGERAAFTVNISAYIGT
jgi:hypothetical protein